MLWDSVALAQLRRSAPAPELSAVEARYAKAVEERRLSAATFVAAHAAGEAASASSYLAASRELAEARKEAVALAERATGAPFHDDTNYIFPSYIVTYLPKGLAGLVIAVIFAAAMSSLSGELSSLATASMVDVYCRFRPRPRTDAQELFVSRVLTGFWGLFAAGVALEAGRLGSAIEAVNKLGSYFYGSILGVFALAVLTPRAEARGAFYGLFAGMIAVGLVANFTRVHFLWYNVIGASVVFAAGLLITRVLPQRPKSAA
jgi:solute:Na+ symporter, SSS family